MEKFGYDPYENFAPGLAQILTLKEKTQEAQSVQEKMEENRVGIPQNPQPANRCVNVASPVQFSWGACKAARTYALYLWKTAETRPEKPLITGLKEGGTPQGLPLKPDTIYFWQVEAQGRYAHPKGEIWCFRTAAVSDPKGEGK